MRTLRKLPASSLCPSAADTFLLPGQLPMRVCAQRPPARSPWPTLGCAHCRQPLQGPPPPSRLDAANCARSEPPWTS